jgi:RNA polymerase sigma-70 factor, ECF subfamily
MDQPPGSDGLGVTFRRPGAVHTLTRWVTEDVTMTDPGTLARQFEGYRTYLRAVAYRMLGSLSDADDVVQEVWLRLQRADPGEIKSLKAWTTRVAARICLDQMASARSRREKYVGEWLPEPWVTDESATDPVERVTLDESVGLAMMVVLETLSPAQRTAFVLHDVFGLPFEEIAELVGRTPAGVRQLASRARHRIEIRRPRFDADLVVQREAIEGFLAAARGGDLAGLVRVLDPDVVWRSDGGGQTGAPRRPVRGAERVAKMVLRQAPTYVDSARLVTVNGALGVAVVAGRRTFRVIGFTVDRGYIVEVLAVYNPDKLRHLRLT